MKSTMCETVVNVRTSGTILSTAQRAAKEKLLAKLELASSCALTRGFRKTSGTYFTEIDMDF